MESMDIYRLQRYKAAFIDYEIGLRQFHEGILALATENRANALPLRALSYELNVKHEYFLECAARLAGER